jgi:hypothetical protein
MTLDGEDYHSDTVPFAFAFAQVKGQIIAVHRREWNRLDVSDPATGMLLTPRSPTSCERGEEKPSHYLDYFHGALSISPNYVRIADDGWVWHPVGIPTIWDIERWLDGNVWESEDGPTRREVTSRSYCWNRPLLWLDDSHLIVGGLGDDDDNMIEGVGIFQCDESPPREILSFAGPAGTMFVQGNTLYSTLRTDMMRWDARDGCLTGQLPGFVPTHQHPGTRELVQLKNDQLIRWRDMAELN